MSLATSIIRHAPAPRRRLLSLLLQMRETAQQRAELSALSDTRLRDLGITPEAARKEADRPFWDLPQRLR